MKDWGNPHKRTPRLFTGATKERGKGELWARVFTVVSLEEHEAG